VNKKVALDEVVVAIPNKCILSSDLAKKEFPVLLDVEDWQALCLFLLQEKNSHNSFWKKYFAILPHLKDFITPFYFSKEEKNSLEECPWWTNFEIPVQEALCNLKIAMEDLDDPVFEFSNEDLEWAFWIVITRSFNFRNIELIPLIDFANHSSETVSQVQENHSEKVIRVISPTGLEKGEQLTISFGGRDTSSFFCFFGDIPTKIFATIEDILLERCVLFCLQRAQVAVEDFLNAINKSRFSQGERLHMFARVKESFQSILPCLEAKEMPVSRKCRIKVVEKIMALRYQESHIMEFGMMELNYLIDDELALTE